MRKSKKIFIILMLTILSIFICFSNIVKAENTTTMKVIAKHNDEKIDINVTDTEYNIVTLKYVHKQISVDQVNYFTGNNEDVHTLNISPAQSITESIPFDGYGTYTIYVKNSNNNILLYYATFSNPEEAPEVNITKDTENPLKITIHAKAKNNNTIAKIKIVKVDDLNAQIDYNTQGTEIEFTPENSVTIDYTVNEAGMYSIYVEDSNKNKVAQRKYIAEKTTSITTKTTVNKETRKVTLSVTDSSYNIVKIKVARKSEISDFDDFKNAGEELKFTQGKSIELSYTAPEDDVYVFYVENEAGMRNMNTVRVFKEGSVSVSITQDTSNPKKLNIVATDIVANIVKMKIAIGENLSKEEIAENGTEIPITKGKEVSTSYTIEKNCTLNIYVEDEEQYKYYKTVSISGIANPTPTPTPTEEKITSSKYSIDNTSKYITGIEKDTIGETFRKNIVSTVDYKIIDSQGNEIQDNTFVTTGSKIKTNKGLEYTLIVKGDLNGDGKISLIDISKIKKAYLQIETLSEIQEKAADINQDGKMSLMDISKIKKVYLGIE